MVNCSFQIKNPGQKRMQVMKRTRRLRRPSPRTVTNRMVRAVLAAGVLLAAPSLCGQHGFAVCVHRGADAPFFIFQLRRSENRKNAANAASFELDCKLPKLPLVNPNTLNWRHLTGTKFLAVGK